MREPGASEWQAALAALDESGHAVLPSLLDVAECRRLAALYDDDSVFRSRTIMARHNYGSGEYRYLRYPLPDTVALLRRALYPRLAPLANEWHRRLRLEPRFPADLDGFLARCHASGQRRPTPLILKYEEGDYNRLHQDLYGEHVFPMQATILLSAPGDDFPEGDFTGGEFVLVETRPRMQSRAEIVPLGQGDAVIFAVNFRPARGRRGDHRVAMRHGVSRLRSGRRFTLGIIFHDAA